MLGHVHIGPTFVLATAIAMGIVNIIMRIVGGHLAVSDVPLLHVLGEALGFAY